VRIFLKMTRSVSLVRGLR